MLDRHGGLLCHLPDAFANRVAEFHGFLADREEVFLCIHGARGPAGGGARGRGPALVSRAARPFRPPPVCPPPPRGAREPAGDEPERTEPGEGAGPSGVFPPTLPQGPARSRRGEPPPVLRVPQRPQGRRPHPRRWRGRADAGAAEGVDEPPEETQTDRGG